MGRAIFYCFKCSVLLREADFEKGLAFKSGDRVACAKCLPEMAARAASTRTFAAKKQETTSRTPRPVPTSTRRVPLAEETPPASNNRKLLLIGGGAIAALLSAVILVIALSGGEPAPPPEPPAAAAPAPAPVEERKVQPPKASPREEEARDAFSKAEALPPDDLAARIRAFDDVAWKHEGTRAADDARQRVNSLKAKLRETVAAAAAALEGEVRARLDREEFGPALDDLEKAKARLDASEWRLEVDRRIRAVHERARPLFDALKAEAAGARGQGHAAQLDRIVARVKAWGVPRYEEELKAEIGIVLAPAADPPPLPKSAVPVEAPPPTAEGKSYRAAWGEALAPAAGRDYEGALAALRKAAGELKEEDVRKQAVADQDDVQKIAAFHAGLLAELAKFPRHRGLTLEWRSAGEVRKSAGGVLQADADRVELRAGKETVFVEWSDATAPSLAALSKADPRTRALFCLVEGEAEAARALLGEKADAVAPKYWMAATAAKAAVPRPPAEEVRARELLYLAEREWRSMETRGPSAEKYRTLRNEFAATATVGRIMPRVLRRSEGGKEYFFAGPDLAAEGTLKRQKDGRLVSSRDSIDEREVLENFSEFGFYALPNTPYRAWVQLGGCCEQVFAAYWQASELVQQDRGKRLAIEPGSLAVAPLKAWIRNLKKTHDHKKEPKSPARWEWVELTLPKFATPGLKRVRILTDQAGFGVGRAVVSSTRKLPPTDAELKELESARAADVPPEPPPDPDLAGHWTLDDGGGTGAADVSGNGRSGAVEGPASWTEGKVGGALQFDGKTTVVRVPDAPDLRPLADFTVAFWMRKGAEAGDWVRVVGKGDTKLRTFGVWEENGDGKRILFQQYDAAGQGIADLWSTATVEIGKWHHVVALRRRAMAAIWLDGKKDVEAPRTGTPGASAEPLTLGFAGFHGYFTGALDDVRLYKRALGDEEIQAIYESGR